MIDKLLPCPFCGGEPLLGNPGLSRLRRISCKNCDASPSSSFSPEDAAAKWNNRVGGAPEPKELSADEQSYADLAASGGIFPEFYAATANKPSAWQVEWIEGGKPVRQFYPDEESARRVKRNVESYVVGVKDPAKVIPLFATVPTPSTAMTARLQARDKYEAIIDGWDAAGEPRPIPPSASADAVREKIGTIIGGYIDSYRMMAADGTGQVYAASVKADLQINILPAVLAAVSSAPVAGEVTDEMVEAGAIGLDADLFARDKYYDHPNVVAKRKEALFTSRLVLEAAHPRKERDE